MRGSLRAQLFSALLLPPIIVAAVLTAVAIRLFREDKELYVYDLSTQTVDLVARDLSSKLEALKVRAEASQSATPPFLALNRRAVAPREKGLPIQITNLSHHGTARLRIRYAGPHENLEVDVPPEALLDLRGHGGGGTRLMLINDEGKLLAHPNASRVTEQRDLSELVAKLRLFEPGTPRVGTRALDLEGTPSLVAAARLPEGSAAVVQAVARRDVFAAAQPLIATAVLASGGVLLFVVLLGLLLGRMIIRPLRRMAGQAAAIARGDFGIETHARVAGDMGRLAESLNTMGTALKRRDTELRSLQNQLLQAERLNTAARMVAKVAKELAGPVDTCFSLANQTLRRLGPERNDLRELQEEIASEADRAANILQSLLRVANREGEAAAQEVDLEILLADVLVSAGPLLERRGLKSTTELGGPLKAQLASPEHLRNALLDLLLFVAEAAAKGSTVTVSAGAREGRCVLGIRFIAQDAASAAQHSLVLSVATMAIEEQGGELRAQTEDQHIRLEIRLPLVGGVSSSRAKATAPSA